LQEFSNTFYSIENKVVVFFSFFVTFFWAMRIVEKGKFRNSKLEKILTATNMDFKDQILQSGDRVAKLRAWSGIHQRAASGKFYFILLWIFSP